MIKRILIVEDDPAISHSFAAFLKRKGYDVECAVDGVEGLRRLRKSAFDLVVSDIMMPRLNGLDFLAAVKEESADLPVVMVTGFAELETAITAMKKGAVDFVTKPFSYDQMEHNIRRILRSSPVTYLHDDDDGLHARLNRKVRELSILYTINEALENADRIDDLFTTITELAREITEAQSCAFYIADQENALYYLKNQSPERDKDTRPPFFSLDAAIAEHLKMEHALTWAGPHETAFYRDAAPKDTDVDSLLIAPLYVRNESFGILAVENRNGKNGRFTASDINFIHILLKKAALHIENNALCETIYKNLVDTLQSLVTTLEAKDKYTERHSHRVTQISLLIARRLGCSAEEINTLQFAAALHDIGKIGISDAILQKAGRLTDTEYEIIKQHPVIGERILQPLGMLPHEKAVIRHHHERWDGNGYPDGLAGRDIPYLARIVSLADAYDAMTSDRVYRKRLSHETALAEIKRNAWYQFDGNMVEAFFSICQDQDRALEHIMAKSA
ncbi:MAG: response regulator [Candidatus Lernaella stagnicola]|nr:response regulator [Candidatus Lernaella stagnicola]